MTINAKHLLFLSPIIQLSCSYEHSMAWVNPGDIVSIVNRQNTIVALSSANACKPTEYQLMAFNNKENVRYTGNIEISKESAPLLATAMIPWGIRHMALAGDTLVVYGGGPKIATSVDLANWVVVEIPSAGAGVKQCIYYGG
jgi:hypothetical protein